MEQQRASVERWKAARDANRRVAHSAERLQFVSRMPLFCECGDPSCDALVLMSRDQYEAVKTDGRLRLTTPGHRAEGAHLVEEGPGHWLQQLG